MKAENESRNRIFLYLFSASAWSISLDPLSSNLKTVPSPFTYVVHPLHPRKPDFIIDCSATLEYNNIVKKGYRNFHCSNNEIDFRNNILRRVVAVYQWKFNLKLWNRIVIILISKRFVKRKFCNYSYSLE